MRQPNLDAAPLDMSSELGTFRSQPEQAGADQARTDLGTKIRRRQAELLAAPDDVRQKYAWLHDENGGVVKLLSSAVVAENQTFLPLRGGGQYYSFVRRTHEYGHGSDVSFRDGQLSTGFAGLDYGYFLNLDDIDLKTISRNGEVPPASLRVSKRAAWSFMWNYSPPHVTADVRCEQRQAQNKTVDGTSVAERVAPMPGTTYLLRSINFHDSDILVAIRVEKFDAKGSAIVAWKILKSFDTPVASGPEPPQ